VDRAREARERAERRLRRAALRLDAALPRIAGVVAEREPAEHLHVRVVARDGQRLLRVGGLLRVRDALWLRGLRLVPVLGDPDRDGAVELGGEALLERGQLGQR